MKTEKTAAAEVKNNLSLPDFNRQQLYIGQYHFFLLKIDENQILTKR